MYNILILLALRITTPKTEIMNLAVMYKSEKIADNSRRLHWFTLRNDVWGRAQKFYTDDVSLPRSWLSASDWLKRFPAPRHAPIRSTTHILERKRRFAGKQWWCRKMPGVFSGYGCTFSICCKTLKLILVSLGAGGFSFAHSLTYSSRLTT